MGRGGHFSRHATCQPFLCKDLAGRLIGSAVVGFFAGAALAGSLLKIDRSGLYSLMAAGAQPCPLIALFVAGFGVLLSPASVATGLALFSRAGNTSRRALFGWYGRERHPDRE